MSLRILVVTATAVEAEVIGKIRGIENIQGGHRCGSLEINTLVAGIGSVSTAWEMHKWISANKKPDLAMNAGIAGSYNDEIKVGDVVMPVTDCFADAGVEDGTKFLTLSEAGLAGASEFPFIDGAIHADSVYTRRMSGIVRPVKAITVNTATGSDTTRDKLLRKFNPDIETMEGATFFYICSRENIPFLAVRAVSNNVEIRNRKNWNIELALSNLTETLNDILLTLM
jgi:futalosine hydrolase